MTRRWDQVDLETWMRSEGQQVKVTFFFWFAILLSVGTPDRLAVGQESEPLAANVFEVPPVGSNARWEETYRAEDRFPPPPRELARALTRGYEAYAAGEMVESLGWLQRIVERPTREDFLVRGPTEDGQVVSMSWATHCLFCALPPKQRELFQIRYGAVAQRKLEAAVAARDSQALAEIMRRYAYTDAGIEAGLMLGYEQFHQGRLGLASSLFRRLRMIPEAQERHDPNLTVLLAICYLKSGQQSAATRLLSELSIPAGTQIDIAGRPVDWFDSSQNPLQWLSGLAALPTSTENRLASQWLVAGGGWNRLTPSGTGFPMKSCRWQVPRVNDLLLEREITEVADSQKAAGPNLSMVSSPIIVGQSVVVRSYDKVMGIDLNTGRRTWYYPAIETFGLPGSQAGLSSASAVDSEEIQQWLQRQGGADDLASDGLRVFFVEQKKSEANLTSGIWINGGRSITSGSNQLVALNVQKQGSLDWIVGGESNSEPKLADAFFLGPPLPIRDELYSIVFQDNLVQLIQQEAATGKVVWQQALASVDSVVRLDNGSQQSLSPAYANGVLVCPTGLGTAVGIDLATRELAWGVSYQQQQQIGRYTRSDTIESRWLGAAAQIFGQYVVLSPQESDKLYCVDLVSGRQMWDEPETVSGRRRIRTAGRPSRQQGTQMEGLPRNNYQLVAAADGDQILNVGREKIRSISLSRGKVLWEKSLPEQQQINGVGFFNRGKVWLPTVNSQIIAIKMADGEIESVVDMPWPIQSMVCNQREVIASSLLHVGAFYQGEVAEAMFEKLAGGDRPSIGTDEFPADETLAQMPIRLVVFKGQLLRYQNRLSESIHLLDYACRRENSPYHQSLLVTVVLEALRDDGEVGEKLFEKYSDLLLTRDPVAVYRFQAEGLLRAEKHQEALRSLLRLAKLPVDTKTEMVWTQTGQQNEQLSWAQLSWAQWAAVKFEKMLSMTAVSDQQEIQAQLWADSAACLREGRYQELLRRCEVLGRYGVTVRQQVQLARQLMRAGQLTEAQWILTPLLKSNDSLNREFDNSSSINIGAEVLAAEVLWQAGFEADAISRLQSLQSTKDARIDDLLTKWKTKSPSSFVSVERGDKWRAGWWATGHDVRFQLDVSAVSQAGTWSTVQPQQTDDRWGLQLPLRWRPNENLLEIYDRSGRSLATQAMKAMSNRRRDPRLQSTGQNWGTMCLTNFGEELVMFDWLQLNRPEQQSQVWIRDLAARDWNLRPEKELGPVRSAIQFDEEYQLFRRGESKYFGATSVLTTDGFLVDTGNGLCLVSTLSGEVKWKRHVDQSVLSIAQGAESFSLFCEGGQVIQLDKTTGQLVGQSKVPFASTDDVFAVGPYVICKSQQDKLVIRVWDMFSNRWIWEETGSGIDSGDVELSVNQADGTVIWASDTGVIRIAELTTGKLLVDSRIAATNVVGMEVQSRRDCWLIVLKQREMSNWQRSNGNMHCSPQPESEELLAGLVYCFDKSASVPSTKMRWQGPVPVRYYCLLDDTEIAAPFAMFACRVSWARALGRGQDLTQVAVLDLRNGQVLLEKSLPTTYQIGFQVDEKKQAMEVRIGSTIGHVRWGDDHQQPPVPLGSLDISESTELVEKMTPPSR